MILSGHCDTCLFGGIESYYNPFTLKWLEREDQLLCKENPWGFIPGEGAGFCLIASKEACISYRWKMPAKIRKCVVLDEKAFDFKEPDYTGDILARTVIQTVEAKPAGEKIDHIYCTLNGQRSMAEEFGFASLRLNKYFYDVSQFVGPVHCWGDMGAASAPSLINLVLQAGQRGYAKGPLNLVYTSDLFLACGCKRIGEDPITKLIRKAKDQFNIQKWGNAHLIRHTMATSCSKTGLICE